jgi:hypothetical protein
MELCTTTTYVRERELGSPSGSDSETWNEP